MRFWDLEFVLLWILLLSKQDVNTLPFYIAVTGLIFSIGRIMTNNNNTETQQNQDNLLVLITKMKEDGYNFNENPAIFRWSFSEHPDLQLMLMIRPTQEGELFDEQGAPTIQ